jgi:hypothetical protein
MPCFVLELPETETNITRPIVHQITYNLLQYLEYPVEPDILLLGSTNDRPQPGSLLEDTQTTSSLPFTTRVQVTHDENYPDQGVLTTPIKQKEHRPVFFDAPLDVSIRPIYFHSNMTLTLACRFTSLTQAQRFRDTIRRRMSQGMQARLHELQYHYAIPPVFLRILQEIYEKREAIAGYGETLEAWWHRCFTPQMSVLANRSGERGQVVIAEKQIQVQGWLSFETQPDKPELHEEGSTWVLTFDYTFEYDKAVSASMHFPIVVHNQLLDEPYVAYEAPYNPYHVARHPSYTGALYDAFSQINYEPSLAFKGARLPEFDDWSAKMTHAGLLPLLTTLVAVELDDPLQLVNLMELGSFTLAQPVLNFLYRERERVTTYLDCVFHITLYKGAYPIDGSGLFLDEDLNVRAQHPLNPRDVHHIQLSLTHRLDLLSKRAKDALRRDPYVCFLIIEWLNLLNHQRLPKATSVGVRSIKERIDQWLQARDKKRPSFDSNDGAYDRIESNYQRDLGLVKPTPTTSASTTLYPSKQSNPNSPYLTDRLVVLGGQVITKDSFETVARQIQPVTNLTHIEHTIGMMTVMQMGLISHRSTTSQ